MPKAQIVDGESPGRAEVGGRIAGGEAGPGCDRDEEVKAVVLRVNSARRAARWRRK